MEKKRRGRRKSEVFTDVVEIVKDEAKELVNEIKEDVAEGLGDTLEKVFKKTGIDKVAKWVLGEDCGCDKRKEKLNKIFPYRKINCLTEDEHGILETFFSRNTAEISPSDQHALLKVYNRVLNVRQEPTSCSSCWRDIVNQLKRIYKEYDDANS
jgi:hypothetical protein